MIISDSISECHNKVANLLTSTVLELKWLSLNKEHNFFYQISDKPISKRTTLERFVATDLLSR